MNHTNDNKISDPKVFGPGMWYSIHISAIQLSEDNFITYIKGIIPKIPCLKCREHAVEYLKNNPIEHFKGIKDNNGEFVGMFKWSWIFHNNVNQRLNYKVLDWDTAYNMYTDDSKICSLDCGE